MRYTEALVFFEGNSYNFKIVFGGVIMLGGRAEMIGRRQLKWVFLDAEWLR